MERFESPRQVQRFLSIHDPRTNADDADPDDY
jgi:hypothetical protein